jgi:hypothetical protein
MPRYMRGEFNSRRVLHGYDRGRHAFAFIMRSLQLVCVDIDGKNGGLDGAKKLILPPTLAETSKSGNGYHLFYLHQEQWDPDTGFGELGDRIGFEQGVDFRATGCVYHHDTQRWNNLAPTLLPAHLKEILVSRRDKIIQRQAGITAALESDDPLEALMIQHEILAKLKKPIKPGMRNQTLFAIGTEMLLAQIDKWDDLLEQRAVSLGLPDEEIAKLVRNIKHYGASAVTP